MESFRDYQRIIETLESKVQEDANRFEWYDKRIQTLEQAMQECLDNWDNTGWGYNQKIKEKFTQILNQK